MTSLSSVTSSTSTFFPPLPSQLPLHLSLPPFIPVTSQLKIEQEAVLRRLEAERNRLVKDLANAEEKGEDREKGGCALPLSLHLFALTSEFSLTLSKAVFISLSILSCITLP
jgi:hypothetical protein